MISFANAKINIGLLITGKREDGYHNIETIFYPVKLYDVVETRIQAEFSFKSHGIAIPEGGLNLCEKAFQLLKKDHDINAVSIDLLKNIPIGAGLGGGSSDAAFVLKALNELNNLNLSNDQLEAYAVQLGADCPFFIQNKPVFASGIGADFEDVELDLSSYYIVLINPEIHISTQEAYANVHPQSPSLDLKRAIRLPIQEWKYNIVNDFELGIFQKYPVIEKLKNAFYEKGAIYAAMSGSGSTVYGIFEEPIILDELTHLGKIYYPVDL